MTDSDVSQDSLASHLLDSDHISWAIYILYHAAVPFGVTIIVPRSSANGLFRSTLDDLHGSSILVMDEHRAELTRLHRTPCSIGIAACMCLNWISYVTNGPLS